MKRDPNTTAWLRDASDELAVRNGCWFEPRAGAYAVWWIERYCNLYEGEWAGEPLRLRGRHDDAHDAWPIPDEFDEALALERHEHYIDGVRRGVPCDWQYECLMRLFGWQRESRRWQRAVRRFRRGSIWVPKKNGKSPTLAAVGLYLLCGDGEQGQKVGICAKDGTQARDIAGKHAIEMVQASPELSACCKINMAEYSIAHVPTRSIMKPLSSTNKRSQESKEGFNGSLLTDETHIVDRAYMRRMKRSGISRAEPLHLEFSTAGNNPDGYGREQFDYGQEVAEGKRQNDQFLFLGYCAPQDTKPEQLVDNPDEVVRLGKLANPAWGRLIAEDELLADWNESQKSVGDTLDFMMYRLNVWQQAVNPWLPPGAWAGCRDTFTLDDLKGEPCVVGFDKARSCDFSAFVALFPEWSGSGLESFRLWPWIIAPEQYLREHENDAPFADWVKQGLLLPSPGDVIDIGFEYSTFGQIHSHCNVLALAYDPHRAEELTQLIEQGATGRSGERLSEGYGIQRIPVGTTSGLMASAVDEFEAFVRDGRVKHPGHEVLDWMFGNVQSFDRGDRTLLAKPKKKDTKKIDAVIGSVVAFAVARNPQFRPQRSVYEEREMLFL
jgi:phage terminase large subunit-like protein